MTCCSKSHTSITYDVSKAQGIVDGDRLLLQESPVPADDRQIAVELRDFAVGAVRDAEIVHADDGISSRGNHGQARDWAHRL